MHLDLSGKIVLVTGGTRGIGRSIVEACVAAGAKTAFTYRSATSEAEALCEMLRKQGGEVLAYQSDAADFAASEQVVNEIVKAWGGLDVLVNNAGVTKDNLLLRMSEADWDVVLTTNLKSIFNFTKAAYRPMMKQRSGSIINLSSVVGVMGNAGQANYAASKAGIIGFSKSMAKELGGRHIRVNVIAPGFIETDMTHVLGDQVKEALLKSIPLGALGKPDDIAAAVLFLASDASRYITGHVLHVDGGMAM
ncbi:MAG TPA: 3-oxoacyl-[acyl-carrier-protein] reductase [Bacteroidetes bacterium]|mgnify:FL=1|nr:3-oxoacyl-[acyl-carrier-protein] reductase [Bacteroidota bacterium]HRR08218.1 3-oxoacyl-[acyl-carrier-protein] reductase [Rhodothermales bacterium]